MDVIIPVLIEQGKDGWLLIRLSGEAYLRARPEPWGWHLLMSEDYEADSTMTVRDIDDLIAALEVLKRHGDDYRL